MPHPSSGDFSIKVNFAQLRKSLQIKKNNIVRFGNRPDIQREIAEYALKYVTPYVPKKSGALRESGVVITHARSAVIRWRAIRPGGETYDEFNYAWVQHEVDAYVHPLGESHWTKEIQPGGREYERLVKTATRIVKREVRKANG